MRSATPTRVSRGQSRSSSSAVVVVGGAGERHGVVLRRAVCARGFVDGGGIGGDASVCSTTRVVES